ncbi:MAG: hypothetical protein ACKO2G_02260 [Verrucomicrobiales bacterium]
MPTHAAPCIYRPAQPDEMGRAASLCTTPTVRPGEGQLHCFVAVRTQPVERILAVAFWHTMPEADGTLTAEVKWSVLPALAAEASLEEAKGRLACLLADCGYTDVARECKLRLKTAPAPLSKQSFDLEGIVREVVRKLGSD